MSDNEYTFEKPPDHLALFVRRIMWIQKREESSPFCTRPLPTGNIYLGWIPYGTVEAKVDNRYVFSSKNYPIHASGQIYEGDVELRMNGGSYHIAAELTAIGAYQLTGILGSTYTDLCIDPIDKNPDLAQHFSDMKEFREKRTHEVYQTEFLDALTSLSKARYSVPQYLVSGVAYIEEADGVFNLSDLCEELQISVRQFRRAFQSIVGVPPKFFGKTIQISRALSYMLSGATDLSQVALDAGFTDQAHFNNAFRSMILSSPKKFLHDADQTIVSVMRSARS